MTLDQVVEIFRELADDLEDNPYLWSPETVDTFADQAEIEACTRKPLLTSSTDTDMCQITVTTGTALYSKHVNVCEVYHAKFVTATDTYYLHITNIDALKVIDSLWEERTGDAKYLLLTDKEVQIVPPPEVDGVLHLDISHTPKEAASTSGAFTIDRAHHFDLIYWMLHLAFSKRDADTHDKNRSMDYEGRFINVFGERPGVNALKGVRTVRDQRDTTGGWI